MRFLEKRNSALRMNPPGGVIQLSVPGSDWLWAVFALFCVFVIVFAVWTAMRPRGGRVFHQMATIVMVIATIAYFSMASDLGWTLVKTEFGHHIGSDLPRQIWWVRYIDQILTVNFMLLTMCLTTGLPLSDIVFTCFVGMIFWVCLLCGALVHSSYKFGYFVFAIAALGYLWTTLYGPIRTSSARLGRTYGRPVLVGAIWVGFLYMLYPICWGLSEGGNSISVTGEMVFYGVLDILVKPVYLTFMLAMIGRDDLARLELYSGKYTDSRPPYATPVVPNNPNAVAVAAAATATANSPAAVVTSEKPPRSRRFFPRRRRGEIPSPSSNDSPPEPIQSVQPVSTAIPAHPVHVHTQPPHASFNYNGYPESQVEAAPRHSEAADTTVSSAPTDEAHLTSHPAGGSSLPPVHGGPGAPVI